MRPEIIQARLVLKGINSNLGKDIAIICAKTQLGVNDSLDIGSYDPKTKFTFASFDYNNAFKQNPIYFPFREGFQYSLEDTTQLCIDNEFDAWLCEGSNIHYLTGSTSGFLITEGNEYLITENDFNLIIE